MNASREMLEGQSERYADKLRETNSYIKELKGRAAEYGTDWEHFEGDLAEAEHNAKYYEAEIARVEGELKNLPRAAGAQAESDTQTGEGALLPRTIKGGVGALLLTSITFAAGALLGARLKSRGGGPAGSKGQRGD